jgi:hypothetical protein
MSTEGCTKVSASLAHSLTGMNSDVKGSYTFVHVPFGFAMRVAHFNSNSPCARPATRTAPGAPVRTMPSSR